MLLGLGGLCWLGWVGCVSRVGCVVLVGRVMSWTQPQRLRAGPRQHKDILSGQLRQQSWLRMLNST